MAEYMCRRCGPVGSTPSAADAHELVHHSGRPTTYKTDPPTAPDALGKQFPKVKATSVRSTLLGNMDSKTRREINEQTRAERNQEDRDDHW